MGHDTHGLGRLDDDVVPTYLPYACGCMEFVGGLETFTVSES